MSQPVTSAPVPFAGRLARAGRYLWRETKDFGGWSGDVTHLWSRWLLLRAVGVVYVLIFSGILVEGQALIAPNGIAQLDELFTQLHRTFPNPAEALLRAPSLFWLGTGSGMITLLTWTGLLSAVAVVLNLWPRMALFSCWLVFLSFASTWRSFSPAQLDNLMLEVALVCIPFAPAGFRPGLGAGAPPRRIALFMMRWLLFRVMLQSGLVKLVSGDPHWRDFTVMDVMYETAPFPTILGYLDHQLPQAYHCFEVVLTFTAELLAPVLAVIGGSRGRWFAFGSWVLLQVGIQLTCNFGWLNAAAIGLALLLLDDRMLAAAAQRFRLTRLANTLRDQARPIVVAPPTGWRCYGLRGALGLHFYLTSFYFAKVCGANVAAWPGLLTGPVEWLREFRSANGYSLYATFEPFRFQVEFIGSNDGGKTWRTYEYRRIPQRVDEISPFIAPWFCRFEATMEIEGWKGRKSPVFPAVAAHLLAGNPQVTALFRRDPFPEGPPTQVRMRGYRLAFTDLETRRKTGHYWRREPDGEYLPMVEVDGEHRMGEATLAEGDAALAARNFPTAFAIFERQYAAGFLPAGFRLAEMLTRGVGVRQNPGAAHALYVALAREGEVRAEHYLGVCHEYGIGVPVDFAKAVAWYRRAGDRGYLLSRYALGVMHANERVTPRNDIEGLACLMQATALAEGDDPISRFIQDDQLRHFKRLTGRMSADGIADAASRSAAPLSRGIRP